MQEMSHKQQTYEKHTKEFCMDSLTLSIHALRPNNHLSGSQ